MMKAVKGLPVLLAWAASLSLVALLVAVVITPRVMGWVPLTVLSGSMEPTYPVGSQVIVERVEGEKAVAALQVGDVITFLPRPGDPTLVTHRIVKKSFRQDGVAIFGTRGDANDADDPWQLSAQQIRAKVRYHVPYIGYAAKSLTQEKKDSGIWVVAGALFVFSLVQLGGLVRGRPGSSAPAGRHRACGRVAS